MRRVRAAERPRSPKVNLDALFAEQRGVVTRGQALAAGLDDEAVRRRLRSRRWQRLLPGIYADHTGAITPEQRLISAALYTRNHGQVTGIGALSWHGLRHLPSDPLVHVLVPHERRRVSRGFVRVQRTNRLDPAPHLADGYVVCAVPRAVADACRGLSEIRDVRAVVAEAVQRGFTTVEAVTEECALAATSRTALLRRAVEEIGNGARSAPEVDLQEVLRPDRRLPPIVWNPTLEAPDGTRLPSPDGYVPEYGIALEVDSREYHLGPEGWERTMWRHNVLTSYGATVLHFTPFELRERRRAVYDVVLRSCAEREKAGDAPPRIRVVHAPGSSC